MSPTAPITRPHALEDAAAIDRLVVASVTFRHLPTDQREAAAEPLEMAARAFTERVVLHTCHRVELIALTEADTSGPSLPSEAHRTGGVAAAERVFLVTGGLDSAVLAEEQILGQVREAYQAALDRDETGPTLNDLLRRAIRFGKRVRSAVTPGADRSIADKAVQWILAQSRTSPSDLRVLVIGTGEMSRLAAMRLAEAGARITVASRSLERATRMIATLSHPSLHFAVDLANAVLDGRRLDAVVIAVRSTSSELELRNLVPDHLPLVADLSAPGAIAGPLADELGDRLLNLDRIQDAGAASPLTPGTEQRFRDEAHLEAIRFGRWMELRSTGNDVAALRSHAEEIRQRHLSRLRHREGMTVDQLEAVQAMTSAMFGELLHAPTLLLRRDPDAAASVRRLFGIEP